MIINKRNIYTMKKLKLFARYLALLTLVIFSSCASKEKIVYLEDMHEGISYPIDYKHEATIHCDDRLSISVSSKNPELAIPFNAQNGTYSISSDGSVSVSDGASSKRVNAYRVDAQGDITFPLIGKLHVEGMTINQATELIRNRIIEGNYIKDPMVSIDFTNFKYSVLGAVGKAGTYTVNGDRITLLEAVANAGDLTKNARLDRVTVIREQHGERQLYVHDIRSKNIFDSPAFYLQQNDVVYVEPKNLDTKREDRTWKFTTFFVSLASLACSLIWALK